MGNIKDLSNERFGRLLVIGYAGKDKEGRALWKCLCDCGNEKIVKSRDLVRGYTRSCGCLWSEAKERGREKAHSMRRKHGLSHTRLYHIWRKAIARCCDVNDPQYRNYGARGIFFFKPWKDSFEEFVSWAINSGYSDELQIDRVDNDKSYSPENCRWVTQEENANNKRTNRRITVGDETHTLAEWSRIVGISSSAIRKRLMRGWSEQVAIETPLRKKG